MQFNTHSMLPGMLLNDIHEPRFIIFIIHIGRVKMTSMLSWQTLRSVICCLEFSPSAARWQVNHITHWHNPRLWRCAHNLHIKFCCVETVARHWYVARKTVLRCTPRCLQREKDFHSSSWQRRDKTPRQFLKFLKSNKNQLDARLCGFYFCRVTLHVSGASAHHQEYLKLVQRPLVHVLSLQVSHHVILLGQINTPDEGRLRPKHVEWLQK
jgi:hypothetical protein